MKGGTSMGKDKHLPISIKNADRDLAHFADDII